MFLRTLASVIASRSACFVSTSAFLASRALSASVFAVLALSNAVCASRSPSLAVFKSFVAFVLSAVLLVIISFWALMILFALLAVLMSLLIESILSSAFTLSAFAWSTVPCFASTSACAVSTLAFAVFTSCSVTWTGVVFTVGLGLPESTSSAWAVAFTAPVPTRIVVKPAPNKISFFFIRLSPFYFWVHYTVINSHFGSFCWKQYNFITYLEFKTKIY